MLQHVATTLKFINIFLFSFCLWKKSKIFILLLLPVVSDFWEMQLQQQQQQLSKDALTCVVGFSLLLTVYGALGGTLCTYVCVANIKQEHVHEADEGVIKKNLHKTWLKYIVVKFKIQKYEKPSKIIIKKIG